MKKKTFTDRLSEMRASHIQIMQIFNSYKVSDSLRHRSKLVMTARRYLGTNFGCLFLKG